MQASILTFDPILKSVIWGGTRIATFKGITADSDTIGESWEVSPMPGHESVVAAGPYKGKTLPELCREFPDQLLGERVARKTGNKFPLLLKLIDSTDDLSVQVHPDDELAADKHGSLGKTEMWYSLDPAPGAYLYAGFNQPVSPDDIRRGVADGSLLDKMIKAHTEPGDYFYLPAGRMHSIGRGNFILEIQEASDITYRVYDYDRRDKDGNPRQLHVEDAIMATDLDDVVADEKKHCDFPDNDDIAVLICHYFGMVLHDVQQGRTLALDRSDSFTIGFVARGSARISAPGTDTIEVHRGQSFVVPAMLRSLKVEGTCRLITIYVPNRY